MKTDPDYFPLQGDPRFEALLRDGKHVRQLLIIRFAPQCLIRPWVLGRGRNNRNEERTLSHVLFDFPVPSVASAQFALVEPHLKPESPQGLAYAPRRVCILGGVTEKDGFAGGFGHDQQGVSGAVTKADLKQPRPLASSMCRTGRDPCCLTGTFKPRLPRRP